MAVMERLGFGIDSSRNNLIALFLILIVFAALGLRLWASTQMANLTGPQQITAQGHDLLISMGDALLRVSPEGALHGTYPLAALGAADHLTDLHALSDGSTLIAVSRPPQLLRCRLEYAECTSLADGDRLPQGRAYKLWTDPAGEGLFIADSGAHQVLKADNLDGPLPRSLALDPRPRFPNQLAMHGGLLWLADTNHHRLAAYRIDGTGGRMVRSIESGAHPDARRTRVWPIAFTFDTGDRAWVINGDNSLGHGDLLGFSADGQPLTRIALPGDADPVFLTRLDDRLFVTDRSRMTVYRVNLTTLEVSELGGAFAERMAEFRAGRQRFAALSSTGLWTLLGALALGLVLAGGGLMERPRSRQDDHAQLSRGTEGRAVTSRKIASLRPAERFPNVEWLEPDPRTMGLVRLALGLVTAFTLLLPFLVMAALRQNTPPDWFSTHETRAFLAVLAVFVMVTLLMLWLVVRGLRTRLGVRGGLLYLRDHRGNALEIPPEVAVSSRRAIAHGPITVVLGDIHRRSLYDAQTLEMKIKPLLDRSRTLGPIRFSIYQFQQRQFTAIAGTVLPLLGLTTLYGVFKWF
ncbi:YncE family protein [Thioalkalivibrio thiocyanodenitrificans]|uniref:YncE family protein n=1 Tax=Thioalkalivibrio thiocyanodenitrificans TaxID=243063 RepID=UPI00036A51C9|nr:hypothetical protein [Thioalkalivibrio thiocyanodenitrificans]